MALDPHLRITVPWDKKGPPSLHAAQGSIWNVSSGCTWLLLAL